MHHKNEKKTRPADKTQQEIEKGCGNDYLEEEFEYICGRGINSLCPICKAKLEGYNLAKQEMENSKCYLELIEEGRKKAKQEALELQEAYNIALEVNNELRDKLKKRIDENSKMPNIADAYEQGVEHAKQEAEAKFNELSKQYIHLSGRLDEEKAKQKEFIDKLKNTIRERDIELSEFDGLGEVMLQKAELFVVMKNIDKLSQEVFGGSNVQ